MLVAAATAAVVAIAVASVLPPISWHRHDRCHGMAKVERWGLSRLQWNLYAGLGTSDTKMYPGSCPRVEVTPLLMSMGCLVKWIDPTPSSREGAPGRPYIYDPKLHGNW
jgi:hypothetical protein